MIQIRNIAIIAHIDHGKTTLVDQLLQQSGALDRSTNGVSRILDSNDLERERGITILSKSTAIEWRDHRINIIDTPGHADFGGEVERILTMVDSVLLLVDAVEGPMPQTRFVTSKALACGFRPILVINKIDRQGARANWVLDQTFDLFDRLGASEEQLDFPVLYASALCGYADHCIPTRSTTMDPLLDDILLHVPPPQVSLQLPLQMQISTLDYSPYVGVMGIGRIQRGTLKPNTRVIVIDRHQKSRYATVQQVLCSQGLKRIEMDSANAGDIVVVIGIDNLRVSDTLCAVESPQALPPLTVNEPTVSMVFQVNTSPFAGESGRYLTSRQIKQRLDRELLHNVALQVETTADSDKFLVSGRGELHLAILIETMRREGYELAVSPPQPILKHIDGQLSEPYEQLTIDINNEHKRSVMEVLGDRAATLCDMIPDNHDRVRLDYTLPARALIGFRTHFMTLTSGTGLLYRSFLHYAACHPKQIVRRTNGVLIANGTGHVLAYALFNLQPRGRLFVSPGDRTYEGMIIGSHSRGGDLVVNPMKAKQLTNMRAAGSDKNIQLSTPQTFDLEQAMEFIAEDELVEITPAAIRIRKQFREEHQRKRARIQQSTDKESLNA